MKIPVLVLLAIVALVGAVTGVGAGGVADRLTAHELLRQVGGFSRADLSAVDRGQPVARILDTDRREIAVVGAVRIRAARELSQTLRVRLAIGFERRARAAG